MAARSAPDPSIVAYRFGDFEADLCRCELRKFAIRVRLERKPWQVLTVLLARHGELVTRAELQAALWPEGTFVDFEHGLNSAIKKLRAALCDSIDQPRYILTFPGEGYRFIALVEPVLQAAPEPQLPPLPVAAASGVPAAAPPRGSRMRLLAATICVLALSGVALLGFRHTPGVHFTSSDWVLVADFDNRTGDSGLNGVLQTGLERELNNSRFVHVVPRERVNDALALMRQPPQSAIDEHVGREICLRDGGIKLLLNGRAEKLGSSYLLSVSIVDPSSGLILHVSTAQASSQDQIGRALHAVGDDLRAALGEDLSAIASSDRQYEKVTTPSLHALQLYSEADRLFIAGRSPATIPLLEEAIKEDPDFASAHLLLGWRLFTKEGIAGARPHFERAFQLAGSASERERLFILGSYYEQAGDYQKARGFYEQLVLLYPDHFWGTNNLYNLTGRRELIYRLADLRPNALEVLLQAWAKAALVNDSAAKARFYQRFRRVYTPEALESKTDSTALLLAPVFDVLGDGDVAAAERELSRVPAIYQSLGPRASMEMAFELANIYLYMGRVHQAQEWSEHTAPEHHLVVAAEIAEARGDRGLLAQWEAALPSHDPNVVYRLAALDDATAVKHYLLRFGPGCDFRRLYVPVCDLADSDTAAAGTELQAMIHGQHNDDINIEAISLLAHQQERAGDVDSAIATLEHLQPSSYLPAMNIAVWPLEMRFHLAELYRRRGRVADAEKVEFELRSLLRDADPDFLLVHKLQRSTADSAKKRSGN